MSKTNRVWYAGMSLLISVAACGGASVQVGTGPAPSSTPPPAPAPAPAPTPAPAPELEVKAMKRVEFQGDRIVIKEKVQFEQGKAIIKPESNGLLDDIAKVFAEHPELKKVEIQGHASGEGDPKVNLKLSDERSKAVMAALVSRNVKADVLVAKGYGSEKKLAEEKTEDDREKNRRVEFIVLDPKPQPGGIRGLAAKK